MKKARPIPILVALVAVVPLSVGAPPVHAQHLEAPEQGHFDRHHARYDHHGYLGVSVRPLNSDLRRHFGAPAESGVLVASVEPNSPADRVGLEVGDVIVAVDGRSVHSVATLHREIRRGHEVEIELYRDGSSLSVEVTLESRRVAFDDRESHWEDWGEGWAEWGEHFGEHWAEQGVEWSEIGAEIGARIAEAFAHLDWNEMDLAVEESMRALDAVDWDGIGDQIEEALEEVDDVLDELDGGSWP